MCGSYSVDTRVGKIQPPSTSPSRQCIDSMHIIMFIQMIIYTVCRADPSKGVEEFWLCSYGINRQM